MNTGHIEGHNQTRGQVALDGWAPSRIPFARPVLPQELIQAYLWRWAIWHPLIKDALTRIEALGNANLTVLQVKEKFGGLRIYLSLSSTEADAIITAAEAEASETCEECGSKEDVKLRGGGWLRTLCDPCEEKRKKR